MPKKKTSSKVKAKLPAKGPKPIKATAKTVVDKNKAVISHPDGQEIFDTENNDVIVIDHK